ncbi:hypothetical protein RND81_09G005500 [Saponaria officinalis]|uniref:Sodium/metabolite cotransporter BASS1, chloroplastic n=1 Tax=Saponaria officinalis TaxID=3572 RepID=A0AAW1IGA4_SAPOF
MQSSLSSPQTLKFQFFSNPIKFKPSINQITTFPTKNIQISCASSLKLRSNYNNYPKKITFFNKKTNFFSSKPTNETSVSTQLHCGNSSNSWSAPEKSKIRVFIEAISEALSTAFPIWVALGCLMGLFRPNYFKWVKPEFQIWGLTITMLGMGMTLTLDDLAGAFSMPKQVLTGFFLQYSVMPLSGYFISKLLGLPSHYAAGLILVGCCPGGTASNIVTYIARGNVALSVLMTAASTFSAVIMTPYLTAKLAGQYVAVDATGLLMSTLQVVLLPVLGGAFLNQYFQGIVRYVSPVMPLIAVGTVAVLCGNAIAQSSTAILQSGLKVVVACNLLHASGFFFGYVLARLARVDESAARTISIEVGMQCRVLFRAFVTRSWVVLWRVSGDVPHLKTRCLIKVSFKFYQRA